MIVPHGQHVNMAPDKYLMKIHRWWNIQIFKFDNWLHHTGNTAIWLLINIWWANILHFALCCHHSYKIKSTINWTKNLEILQFLCYMKKVCLDSFLLILIWSSKLGNFESCSTSFELKGRPAIFHQPGEEIRLARNSCQKQFPPDFWEIWIFCVAQYILPQNIYIVLVNLFHSISIWEMY